MKKMIWSSLLPLLLLLTACAPETVSCPAAEPTPDESAPPASEETVPDHTHAPAAQPLTVEAPVSGYCGNTVTEVTLAGETYSFWGGDSVALTDLLINLAYDPDAVCRCLPAFTVDTEFGSGYGVDLADSYARCGDGQAALTAEQVQTIRDILQRNCT